ncbi:MFS transporter [Variovorax terrae]|uniref:MFS transporter n=1 Tax=Variovorax terrae TaxID=2923278 RepID=A0A9X2ALK6_9BURK|nr:MFS transporter [Variovorax terrae]MCJ0762409.1 MFS transporter [Variovorax terrae]
MNASRAGPRLTTLIFLSAIAALPVNMFTPSLPHIAQAFGADFALVNLSVAGFAVVAALTQLVAGPLSDRYGRRPVVLAAVALFTVASVGCALAPSIGVFLLFRLMQAVIATGYSVSLAIIRESSGEREAASKMGYVASSWAIAPMAGPAFGGLLDQVFGWRANFVAFAILGAAVLALAAADLKAPPKSAARPLASYLRGYGDLLGSARFGAYVLCMAFSIGTLYIFLGAAASAAGPSLEGSSARLGLLMGMVPAGFIVGSRLASRYAARYPLSTTVLAGRLLTCAGLLAGLLLSLCGATHVFAFFGPCVFIGLGNGLTMPGANAGALSVRPDLAGTAAGLAASLTLAGGALVASASGLFLTEASGTQALLCVMLASATLGLAAALYAVWLDRRS